MDKYMSKRFYISNVITDLKSEHKHNYRTDEIKFVLLLFSKNRGITQKQIYTLIFLKKDVSYMQYTFHSFYQF